MVYVTASPKWHSIKSCVAGRDLEQERKASSYSNQDSKLNKDPTNIIDPRKRLSTKLMEMLHLWNSHGQCTGAPNALLTSFSPFAH